MILLIFVFLLTLFEYKKKKTKKPKRRRKVIAFQGTKHYPLESWTKKTFDLDIKGKVIFST
jgi:hypothetical protein